jgi:DNA-binding Xre family transcriptional regulator
MSTITRILKTNRDRLLAEAAKGKVRFARDLGVHLTTLNSLLDDNWERIERDTIERLCDYLNCDLTGLFSLEPDRFWQPLIDSSSYRILRGVVIRNGVKTFLEEQAKTSVINFLQGYLPKVTGGFADSLDDADAIIDYARHNNCVVIGAHPSNRACEVLVSRHFGAIPFNARSENRKNVLFRIVKPNTIRRSAFFEPSASLHLGSKSGLGVYSEALGRLIVEVDRIPEEEYLKARIRKGHDAAIVLVVNKPFNTERNVKLIVLAGFSRVGTLAAATALAEEYRNLEPAAGATVGVLDVVFEKASGGDDRRLLGYDWVYLHGGRKTVLPKDYPRPDTK